MAERPWRSIGKDRPSLANKLRREPEEEGVDKDYYSFLNLSPDCTLDDIKAAYKRLALIWHPDRHSAEGARAHATAKFARLTHIYEVLTNPQRRQLYDLYGEKGLSSGLEVGAHLKTPEQMRAEYAKHSAKKAERELERKLGLAGILQTTVSLERQLMRFLQPDVAQPRVQQRRRDGRGRKHRGQILESMLLSERFKTSISTKDSAELQGYMKTDKGEGSCAVSLALERRFSTRSSLKAIMEMGMGVMPRPLSLVALRSLSSNSQGKMALRFSEAYTELRCSVSRNLTSSMLGKIQYIVGGPQTGVKLRGSRAGPNSLITGTFWAGFGVYSLGISAQKRLSKRTMMSLNAMIGERGLDLVMGCNRKISEKSGFSCSCVLSTMRGVVLKLGLDRMGQDFSVPIILSRELTMQSITAGTIFPAVLGSLIKALWLRPRAIARRRRKLQRERETNAEQISKARAEAKTDIELMQFAVARKRQTEQARGGLIIEKAIFGRIPQPPSRRRGGNPDEEWPAAGDTTIEVTTPLQYLLEDSKLQLFNSAKSGLPGFCDPAPGEDKQLYVLYRFKGKLHEALIGDRQPLFMPLERDVLAQDAVRVVGGKQISHEAPRARAAAR